MSLRDGSDGGEWASTPEELCPRCLGLVYLRDGKIRPHRDELTFEPCPTEGMTPTEARAWIDKMRAEFDRRCREMFAVRQRPK